VTSFRRVRSLGEVLLDRSVPDEAVVAMYLPAGDGDWREEAMLTVVGPWWT
jgi:hypothetical protein